MKKIEGAPKNLKQLLQNTKYAIHDYQREYMWQKNHIEELIDDLTSEFLEYYKPEDDRSKVADYGVYFMGSIVLAGRENAIIDGQQRLTSLTLILIHLVNRLRVIGKNYNLIEAMIFSEAFGKKSFNINVDDREECMAALFRGDVYDVTNASESVANLCARYNDISTILPVHIKDEMLLHFCDWIAEKVFFIEIVAAAEQDAHKIFITMNDRGLSLTSTEMLKGYLLSEISDDAERAKLNQIWKERVLSLKKIEDKGDENFIKSWLRSQYAESIRESKAGAVNKDFDIIGGPFHKWVRDEKERLGLNSSRDFIDFIEKFVKFSKIYEKIREAELNFREDTKYIYFNARVNFTLQPQLLLAPIKYNDDWNTIQTKLNLTARFIDLYIISRVTNYNSVDYSTIKNYIFNITKDIRNTSVDQLKQKLSENYAVLRYDPSKAIASLRLNNFTKKYIKHILARITDYLERETGIQGNYCDYMNVQTKNPFEIEHILTDHYSIFSSEYTDEEEFQRWRNNIGALLLLRKSINASLNDSLYHEKIQKYCSNEGNIYTETLGAIAYKNHPKFLNFIRMKNLPFKPYDKFGKQEILERNQLVAMLTTLIWNDEMFK